MCKVLKISKIRQVKNQIILEPLTKYTTKTKTGYRLVEELKVMLENFVKNKEEAEKNSEKEDNISR